MADWCKTKIASMFGYIMVVFLCHPTIMCSVNFNASDS